MDHSTPPPPSTPFVGAAWCLWVIGPGTMLFDVFLSAPIIGSRETSVPMPFFIPANGIALVLLLLAAHKWQGWRYRECWLLLGYFFFLSVAMVLGSAATQWPMEPLKWTTFATVILMLIIGLAMPVLAIPRAFRPAKEAWEEELARSKNSDTPR